MLAPQLTSHFHPPAMTIGTKNNKCNMKHHQAHGQHSPRHRGSPAERQHLPPLSDDRSRAPPGLGARSSTHSTERTTF